MKSRSTLRRIAVGTLLLIACSYATLNESAKADFYGDRGYTVYIAFSESTGKYGWAYNRNPFFAKQQAIANCNAADAKIACYQSDGWAVLVWSGSNYAYGHSSDSAQQAYNHAVESFDDLHGGYPENVKCRSSDGHVIIPR